MNAPAPASLSPKQVALLHVAKRDLKLTDDDYRSILVRLGGVESTAELGLAGFLSVIDHFNALGFKSTWSKRTYGNRPGMASPSQVDLIRKLWGEYHRADDAGDVALNAWLARFHKVSALRFVSAEKAGKIIPALRAMASRPAKPFLKGN